MGLSIYWTKGIKVREEMRNCFVFLLKVVFVSFNYALFAIGSVFLGVGVYSYMETRGLGDASLIVTNPSVMVIALGCFILLMGSGGVIGALRHSKIILLVYLGVVLLGLICDGGVVALLFLTEDSLSEFITGVTDNLITHYRDDNDLRNAIDQLQTVMSCCGGAGPNDWQLNSYYNCSAPGVEACGVPRSCCKGELRINNQCGYGVLNRNDPMANERYTTNLNADGCGKAVFNMIQGNQYFLYGAGAFIACELLILLTTVLMIATIGKDGRIKPAERQQDRETSLKRTQYIKVASNPKLVKAKHTIRSIA